MAKRPTILTRTRHDADYADDNDHEGVNDNDDEDDGTGKQIHR